LALTNIGIVRAATVAMWVTNLVYGSTTINHIREIEIVGGEVEVSSHLISSWSCLTSECAESIQHKAVTALEIAALLSAATAEPQCVVVPGAALAIVGAL
jgi:hypothetical protein